MQVRRNQQTITVIACRVLEMDLYRSFAKLMAGLLSVRNKPSDKRSNRFVLPTLEFQAKRTSI
jgi:hypothetical protein